MLPPITDLPELLRKMRPVKRPGVFVFATIPDLARIPTGTIAWFREDEGISVVLPRDEAKRLGIEFTFESAWITLTVCSALEAVGLTAAVAAKLAEEGISCNVVAGYHHDHLFVPVRRAEDALAALERLQQKAQS
jgi:hypothetical protein